MLQLSPLKVFDHIWQMSSFQLLIKLFCYAIEILDLQWNSHYTWTSPSKVFEINFLIKISEKKDWISENKRFFLELFMNLATWFPRIVRRLAFTEYRPMTAVNIKYCSLHFLLSDSTPFGKLFCSQPFHNAYLSLYKGMDFSFPLYWPSLKQTPSNSKAS